MHAEETGRARAWGVLPSCSETVVARNGLYTHSSSPATAARLRGVHRAGGIYRVTFIRAGAGWK